MTPDELAAGLYMNVARLDAKEQMRDMYAKRFADHGGEGPLLRQAGEPASVVEEVEIKQWQAEQKAKMNRR